jgi:glucokinase
VLGIDVGGTTFTVVLLDRDARVITATEEPLPLGLAPAAIIKTIAATARGIAVDAGLADDLAGAGLAVPGHVDAARGVLRSAPNLAGWHDVPVGEIAADVLDAPVAVEHDVRMAALGEARLGAGRGVASFVCVTVGTGIGAALVLDGRLHRGASGSAGEIGHVRVGEGDEPCGCGRRGCLETIASGRAIATRVRRLTGDATVCARQVFAAAAAGDATCARVVDEAARALGQGLALLVNVLNPEVIAIGGGVAGAGAAYLDRVRAAVRDAAWAPAAAVVRVVPAALGTRAGAIGAALNCWIRGDEADSWIKGDEASPLRPPALRAPSESAPSAGAGDRPRRRSC